MAAIRDRTTSATGSNFSCGRRSSPAASSRIAHRGKVVAEYAFGHANLATGEKLTPRHRFRIASHSKSFTAAGIMKLRERRKLRLDDPVGQYVKGLHPQVAETTIAQLLSHSAGLTRDGADSGQFTDSRPYLEPEGTDGGAPVAACDRAQHAASNIPTTASDCLAL